MSKLLEFVYECAKIKVDDRLKPFFVMPKTPWHDMFQIQTTRFNFHVLHSD